MDVRICFLLAMVFITSSSANERIVKKTVDSRTNSVESLASLVSESVMEADEESSAFSDEKAKKALPHRMDDIWQEIIKLLKELGDDLNKRIDANAALAQQNKKNIGDIYGSLSTNTEHIKMNIDILGKNTRNITKITGRIGKNLASIGKNDESIKKNAGGIGKNMASIGKNTGNIKKNTASIGKNFASIGKSSGSIKKNTGSIRKNLASIEKNTASIGTSVASFNKLESGVKLNGIGVQATIAATKKEDRYLVLWLLLNRDPNNARLKKLMVVDPKNCEAKTYHYGNAITEGTCPNEGGITRDFRFTKKFSKIPEVVSFQFIPGEAPGHPSSGKDPLGGQSKVTTEAFADYYCFSYFYSKPLHIAYLACQV